MRENLLSGSKAPRDLCKCISYQRVLCRLSLSSIRCLVVLGHDRLQAWCRTREMVILGTQYAGEMKKGIFSVMHYLMPKRGILSLHSGCNVGANDDVSLFFGLSGTFPKRSRL